MIEDNSMLYVPNGLSSCRYDWRTYPNHLLARVYKTTHGAFPRKTISCSTFFEPRPGGKIKTISSSTGKFMKTFRKFSVVFELRAWRRFAAATGYRLGAFWGLVGAFGLPMLCGVWCMLKCGPNGAWARPALSCRAEAQVGPPSKYVASSNSPKNTLYTQYRPYVQKRTKKHFEVQNKVQNATRLFNHCQSPLFDVMFPYGGSLFGRGRTLGEFRALFRGFFPRVVVGGKIRVVPRRITIEVLSYTNMSYEERSCRGLAAAPPPPGDGSMRQSEGAIHNAHPGHTPVW